MSKINDERRSLLQGAALVSAVASIPLTAGATLKPVADHLQRTEFPVPDFESHVDDFVTIRAQDGTQLDGVIESVEALSFDCAQHRRPGYLRRCSLAVRFKVAGAADLDSDVYRVKHAKLGDLDLLLTTVPNLEGEIGLEAIFN